ncbi:MAG TPA: ADP-ribosylglycohydrolase family protein [Candidatus Ozemobacteraceae bacterium]|nr:ADP-ribosylglycohydrolase family protein [Candidatus Ozemobacteraceae bacterium]
MRERAVIGSLLGTALGDSLGLPYENIGPARAARMFPPPLRHRFFFGRGMVSDDTEHAALTALALARSRGAEAAFTRDLAWSLRLWILCVPAGIGFATLRSLVKLWLGWSPARSGVFSAGNGPAMRAPVIGACFSADCANDGATPEAAASAAQRRALVRASTLITHSDPRAEQGAQLAALAAACAARADRPEDAPDRFRALLRSCIPDLAPEWIPLLESAASSAASGVTTQAFAASQGWKSGVSGYMLHTIPAVLHAWYRSPGDLRSALADIIEAGGDTDTTAAILGGIVGAGTSPDAFPRDLLDGLRDWPWSVEFLRACGAAAASPEKPAPTVFWPLVLPRNVAFAAIVITHGFRRLLPPY